MKFLLQVRFCFLLFLFFVCSLASAQTGSWFPVGANLSYPRTLLKASEVAAVQQSISEPSRYSLYADLYSSTLSSPPAGNTSSSDRRNRAAFAKNAAFVLLMDRTPVNGTLISLSTTDRERLLGHVKTLLENINVAVESYSVFSSSYTEWQWRSKELIDYMVAYDLLRGTGETTASLEISRTRLQTFAGNLYRNSTTASFGMTFYSMVKNNHQLMTAAALGLSAVVLNDVGGTEAWLQPSNWINTGLYNIDNLLWRDASRQSNPAIIAGYAEGPYYFKYAFLNCLPFIRSMGNFLPAGNLNYSYNNSTRSIPNPYFDPAYDLLYEWITAIQMPDGRFPALEDSYIDMGMPELALTGKSRFVNPMYFSKLDKQQLYNLTAQLRTTVDMRAAFLAANIKFTVTENKKLTVLPASGNLVFRSGNDSLANYLHLYGKNGLAQTVTGGHNQGDAGSFLLHAKGQLLALDPGYLSSTRRGEVGEGAHHNLLLVDGAGPAMGTAGTTNDAEAFIQNTFSTGLLHYGEVRTAYRAATITRKALFIRDSYYIIADYVTSTSPHTYSWQLHGYGLEGGTSATGTFSDSLASHTGTWHKNGVNLKAHVTATGGASAYAKVTNVHELIYNTPENHTTIQVHKNNVLHTQFLSLLYPYTTVAASVKTLSQTGTAALGATENGYQDLAFAQAQPTTLTQSGLPQIVTSDGLLTFFSLDPSGQFSQSYVEQGTLLLYGEKSIVQSSTRSNISWQKSGQYKFSGYTSSATTLKISVEEEPLTVTGENISSYAYDASGKQLTITFRGPAAFEVALSELITQGALPITLAHFSGKRKAGQVQLNWKTATEVNNKGFEILRQTAGEATFQRIGFVTSKGNSAVQQVYTYSDFTAPSTTVYYRLKQIDYNEATSFSPIIALQQVETLPQHALTAAPNPADGAATISFSDPAKEVQLRLVNSNGLVVAKQVFKQQTQLKTNHLPSGLYLLQVYDMSGMPVSETRKFIIRH